jgi:hypothetical protein
MAVPQDLVSILGPNEQIAVYLKQKFYHVKIDIDSVVITNQRIILRHPHALGLKKDYTDYNYRDLENVNLDRGIMRSTLRLTLKFNGPPITLNDIPKADADKAYTTIRENINNTQTAAQTQETMPPMIFCKYCGAKNKPQDTNCTNCGAPLN